MLLEEDAKRDRALASSSREQVDLQLGELGGRVTAIELAPPRSPSFWRLSLAATFVVIAMSAIAAVTYFIVAAFT